MTGYCRRGCADSVIAAKSTKASAPIFRSVAAKLCRTGARAGPHAAAGCELANEALHLFEREYFQGVAILVAPFVRSHSALYSFPYLHAFSVRIKQDQIRGNYRV